MPDPLLIAKDTRGEHELALLPALANRHGLITGATGTGKTVTLQRMAESLSRIGVPVFAADIKGDLSGIAALGEAKDFLVKRANDVGFKYMTDEFPVVFWDLFGEQGHPIRTTVSKAAPRPSMRTTLSVVTLGSPAGPAAHEGAVVLHRGETYLVREMDLDTRRIRVRRSASGAGASCSRWRRASMKASIGWCESAPDACEGTAGGTSGRTGGWKAQNGS